MKVHKFTRGGYPQILGEGVCELCELSFPGVISSPLSFQTPSFSRYEANPCKSKFTNLPVSLDVPSQSVATDFLQSIQGCATTITGILP